jgi:hypothetical protein
MYSLKIENNNIEISPEFSVTLSYNAIDLLNPINRNGAFTYTIDLPRSANNNKQFNYVGEYDVIDKFKINEFNCTLSYLNNEIIRGIFYLDEITETSFRGQIVSDNLSWTKYFKDDDRLNTLSGFSIPFPYENDKTSTFRTLQSLALTGTSNNSDINFPFITRGNYNSFYYEQRKNDIMSNETTIAPNSAYTYFNCLDIPPSYYLNNSIKNVFAYYGLNVESNVFNVNEDTIIPYCGNGEFPWNWGRLGNARLEYSASSSPKTATLESYFNNISRYEERVRRSTLENFYGFRYLVLYNGNITIATTGRSTGTNIRIGVSSDKENEYEILASGSTNFGSQYSAVTYTGDFNVGDVIYLMGQVGGFVNVKDIFQSIYIHYNNEEELLNPQNILPSITPLEWVRNFINMFGLYPYYVEYTKTVYLLTLDEFLKKDDFSLISIVNKSIKDYENKIIGSLKYQYDDKDPLISEFQYDFLKTKGVQVQLLFAPSSTRQFIVSNYNGSIYSAVTTNITSIATQDLIDLDRLTYSEADVVDYVPWDSTVTYAKGDLVSYQQNYYISKFDANLNYLPTNTQTWLKSFVGTYNTDNDWNFKTRILNTVKSATMDDLEGNYIKSDKGEKLFYLESEFPEDFYLTNVINNYYLNYNVLINNRTNVIEGNAYIPRHKFNEYINRPIEINYLNDRYILLGISIYNPETEIGKVQVIKKVSYTDYI